MSTESHTRTDEPSAEKPTAVQRRIRASSERAPTACDRYLFLGTDVDGFHHVANQQHRTLFRIDAEAGTIDCRATYADLPEPRLDCYIDAFAGGVGWDDRRVMKSERFWAGFQE